MGMSVQFDEQAKIRPFVLGGNARFTLCSKKTEKRFTYRVRASEDGKIFFVSVLNGPDNWTNYQYLGTINPNNNRYYHGKKTKISKEAGSAKAFQWFWDRLIKGDCTKAMEFWFASKCGKCARPLTVPESVACGFGPDCAEMLGIAWEKPDAPVQTSMEYTPDEDGWEPSQGPKPGTYAYTARMMAESGIMSGEEADAWKDRMKDQMYG